MNYEFYENENNNKKLRHGVNCVISDKAKFGVNVNLGHNCIIEEDVIIGNNSQIDSNTIIRKGTRLGDNSFVGSNCIIGEYQNDYIFKQERVDYRLIIGSNSLIRSGTIIYSNSTIGDYFQTGHHVTIREKSNIGAHVSVGTLSDIQGLCTIGNYTRLHSNVHIGQHSVIDGYVWIFPYVILTNDPTPPSEELVGVHISNFAIVATGAVLLPGVCIGKDSLVGAGAIVTKDVPELSVAVGNPAKVVSDVRTIKNKLTGENVYPWRFHFDRNMPWEKVGYEQWEKDHMTSLNERKDD